VELAMPESNSDWQEAGKSIQILFYSANFSRTSLIFTPFLFVVVSIMFFLFSTFFRGVPFDSTTPTHRTIKGWHQQGASIAAF